MIATGDEIRTYTQTIGEIVKRLRVASGMTPEQLAVSAQLSPSFIRKLEGGARGRGRDITLETAKKLADGLGVSPSVFFGSEVQGPSPLLVPPANPQAARQLLQWNASLQMGIAAMIEENERLRVLADAAPSGSMFSLWCPQSRVPQGTVPNSCGAWVEVV